MPTSQRQPERPRRGPSRRRRPGRATRQSRPATMPRVGLPWPANQQATAPKTAASAIRSTVESSTAPNTVEPPCARAIAPSTQSVSAQRRDDQRARRRRSPRAHEDERADHRRRRVPATVTAFGGDAVLTQPARPAARSPVASRCGRTGRGRDLSWWAHLSGAVARGGASTGGRRAVGPQCFRRKSAQKSCRCTSRRVSNRQDAGTSDETTGGGRWRRKATGEAEHGGVAAPVVDDPEQSPQRGARGPLRLRQDDAGRGAARRHRHDPAGRLGRRRHHGVRLRPGRGHASSARSRWPVAPLDARRR